MFGFLVRLWVGFKTPNDVAARVMFMRGYKEAGANPDSVTGAFVDEATSSLMVMADVFGRTKGRNGAKYYIIEEAPKIGRMFGESVVCGRSWCIENDRLWILDVLDRHHVPIVR